MTTESTPAPQDRLDDLIAIVSQRPSDESANLTWGDVAALLNHLATIRDRLSNLHADAESLRAAHPQSPSPESRSSAL